MRFIQLYKLLYIKIIGMDLRLKELRKEYGYTQKKIAEVLNVKQNTYSQYERCQREIPLDCLVKLAKLYGTSTDYILMITDDDSPYK